MDKLKAIILYYTVYGNTEKAARAIAEGMMAAGVTVYCADIRSVKPMEVEEYDFVTVGAPTHYGTVPEEVKTLLCGFGKAKLEGKHGVAFDTRYEGEDEGAADALTDYLSGLGIKVELPGLPILLPAWAPEGPLKSGELEKCREFGYSLMSKT